MNDQSYPKEADKARLKTYAHYERLYAGKHYEAFSIKGEKDFSQQYNRLRYVVANFCGLLSRTMADMLFGETLRVDLEEDQNQLFVDALFESNQLLTQLYESSLANSYRGDSLFKIRIGQRNPEVLNSPMEIIIEEVTPAIYLPELNKMATRYTPTKDVVAMLFEQDGKTYLHKEIHVPGYIYHEVYLYNKETEKIVGTMDAQAFGYPLQEETKVSRGLVFHIPNVRDGSGYFGTSDYSDIESLQFALENRITKTDNILDKHSDPILAVPPGVINEKGEVNRKALTMLEVDNENPGFNKPEYIVWNANLDSAFKEIDKLVDFLFMFSETSPAGTPADVSGGQAESGRALKFRLLASLRKRKRKILYYDQAIKDMIQTAMELSVANRIPMGGIIPTVERPSLKWGDGIINDQVEQVDIAVKRVDAGLSSRADEISNLDDISPEKAQAKVKEIDEEATQVVPVPENTTTGGATAPEPKQV